MFDPNRHTNSPAYVKNQPQYAPGSLHPELAKLTSRPSYSSDETWAQEDVEIEAVTREGEDLPPYQEQSLTPLPIPSRSTLSIVSAGRSQPRTMCPCAQCYRLR